MSRLDVEATAADWGSIPYHSTNYIADDPIPPASSPRIPIPRILLLLNLAYNACAMVHLICIALTNGAGVGLVSGLVEGGVEAGRRRHSGP